MKEVKKEETKVKIVKFNLEEENAIRERSKRFHKLAKQIRTAGFPLKSISSIDNIPELKRKYQNKIVGVAEFEIEKDKLNEVQDYIATSTKGIVLETIEYKYPGDIFVNRVIVDCTNV